MAATQRVPRNHRRRETGKVKRQTAKTHEVVWLVFIAISVAALLPGCKSGRATKSVAFDSSISYPEFEVAAVAEPSESSPKPRFGLVGYQEPAEQIETAGDEVAAIADSNELPDEQVPESAQQPAELNKISIEQVLNSVTRSYPEIQIAMGEIEAAQGKLLSSYGEFDSVFAAHSISQPLGFYQNYRNGLGVAQPLMNGGEVYGTYRIGRGKFEPWYGERATDEAGEFKAGFSLPLLKGRAIDSRRTALRLAEANRDKVEADVESRLLQFQRFASQAYWDWRATGRAVQIQQQLLELAQVRVAQINERVKQGDLATLAQIDNDRFIAKRQNGLIKARRALEKSAIKLSMFYRDGNGAPMIPAPEQIPSEIPSAQRITNVQRDADAANAITVRPELLVLNAARRQACVELEYAKNLTLPKLDMKGYAAKDIGQLASSLGDKRPFQMNVGVYAEVPIQRREAQGKIQTAEGKIAQIDAKSRFVTDKIRAEIQDAASAVNAALDQIDQSQKNVDLTKRSLELGRQSFEAGDIDLIALNIYETAVADAELQLLDAQFKYFFYQIVYETAKSAQAFTQ